MGKVSIITPEQELLLNQFKLNEYLTSHFYFTGGTALGMYYLQHRLSVDLDFFSGEKFDPQTILRIATTWAKKLNAQITYIPAEDTHIFNFTFANQNTVKVDFAFYPYKTVRKGNREGAFAVDSLLDIAINKLMVIQQRSEVKDFVDLYFILELKKFTIWDLIEGIQTKFKVNVDTFIIGSDFLKVEQFNFLPEMVKPLTLDKLKSYFKKMARELGEGILT